ncbi:hypothetical protein BS50DRAFT_629060 [Corynespora cassiicola Philippines]|uniref:Uncharacterized protein n=1 Tax=Corynespora cassiicola Philippines TaxID=1448308 RepID=A0A2T2P648_CORCC|nr:hypothetical protein BS50DRAFT_629060 [Corynespora cassiicola Philippines]
MLFLYAHGEEKNRRRIRVKIRACPPHLQLQWLHRSALTNIQLPLRPYQEAQVGVGRSTSKWGAVRHSEKEDRAPATVEKATCNLSLPSKGVREKNDEENERCATVPLRSTWSENNNKIVEVLGTAPQDDNGSLIRKKVLSGVRIAVVVTATKEKSNSWTRRVLHERAETEVPR